MSEYRPIILIVEDEVHIANLIKINLELEGYETIHSITGQKAIETVKNQKIDLIILDVMLPDSNGVDICRKIKHLRKSIPILMLSALGQSSDKIRGLKSGADDYLAKPFNLEELLLRLDNLLVRFPGNEQVNKDRIQIGQSTINLANFVITTGTHQYQLTAKEIELLRYMYERRNQVLSRQEILENVWGFEVYPNTRTIDNFISSFRRYVGDDVQVPKYFITVRGVGYKLSV